MNDKHLKLRNACLGDAEILFSWRNDAETSKWSCNTSPVSLKEHGSWIRAKLSDSNCEILIAELNGEAVGVVRLEFDAQLCWLSWTVAPEFRGQKIGKQMLNLVVRDINVPIAAKIKEGHAASINIAESLGMELRAKKDGIFYYHSKYLEEK